MIRTFLSYSQNLKYFEINDEQNMWERWLYRDDELPVEDDTIEDGHPEDS